MTGTVSPLPRAICLDDNGVIVPGGLIFVYAAATTTKVTTYSDAAMSSSNTNPVVADAEGRATIFLAPGSYKFVYSPANDTDPPTNPFWTVDNVGSVPFVTANIDVTGTAGEL